MVIGLTGGVATGKTLVAEIFKSLGARVIDADVVARSIVEPQMDAYNEIVEEFGTEILSSDKTINRKALGNIVFSDNKKLKKLNAITHPRIKQRVLEEISQITTAQPERIIVSVVPLLIEEGSYKTVDKVVLVTATKENQISRYIEREKKSEEDALKVIATQMTDEEKSIYADYIIENNGTVGKLKEKAKELYSSLALIKNQK